MSTLLTFFPIRRISQTATQNPRSLRPCSTRLNYTDSFTAPRDGGARTHYGTDIMSPLGSEIVAAREGRVITSTKLTGPTGRTGHGVTILSPDGLKIHYAHMRGPPLVDSGDTVRAGQLLGYVGQTGNAQNSCPHLHIHAEKNGARVNLYEELRRTQQEGAVTDNQNTENQSIPLTDAEFNQKLRALHGWTRSFRIKRDWWEGDDERQSAARAVREDSTRLILQSIAAAREKRSSGQVDLSNQIVAQSIRFISLMNNYNQNLSPQTTSQQLISNVAQFGTTLTGLVLLGAQIPAAITSELAARASSAIAPALDRFTPYGLAVAAGAIAVLLFFATREK